MAGPHIGQRLRALPARGAARVLDAAAFTLSLLPALALAWLCLRLADSLHAGAAGILQSRLFGVGVGNDALSLLRYGFVFLLGSLPLAWIRSRRWRTACLGILWSLLLCLGAVLLQYQWVAGVPLGADLFAYSGSEIATTVGGGWQASPLLLGALLLSLGVLWGLLRLSRHEPWPLAGRRTAGIALAASLAAFAFLPGRLTPAVVRTDAELDFVANKLAHFADSSLAGLRGEAGAEAAHGPSTGQAPWEGKDPRYPFLRAERTPDTLGPLFQRADGPPNLVFIIVEGLGRSFSGPGARLGSFTPFLDELARRSLYFENFLAGQGRTFGVLTTVFGSLPFGEQGLAALGERMPQHASLLSVLKSQGYDLRFYSGSNMEFDNEGLFLRRQGVDTIVSEPDYGPGVQRANDWGYADRELMTMALRREAASQEKLRRQPFASIIQTTSMHSPFTFPGRDAYLERVDRHVARSGLAGRAEYRNQREVFASILYTDDALRLFFEEAARLPGYANTVFVITGDHRLPELPMDTRIERYHVPLIVYSPLLKKPAAIKSVSSQFDIAPSLLAWLSKDYGLRTPQQVSWLGTGLDTEASFRNLHAIPLKQTRTEMSDFVSGAAYLAQGKLYLLSDGMNIDRADNPLAQSQALAQFRAFLQANRQAGASSALAPAGVPLVAYGGERSLHGVPLVQQAGAVGVRGVRPRPGSGALAIEARITNDGASRSRAFAPLLVITDVHGHELGETTGAVRTLGPGESMQVSLRPAMRQLPPGTYYVSVIPSDPDSGRSIGVGQYHVELQR